jgi:DNA-directed RNA polymerase subunit RPC12/RpoP
MQISCPKCGESIPVDHAEADDTGKVRLQCGECSARLLIKVNRPELKVDQSIPLTPAPEPAPDVPQNGRLDELDDLSIERSTGDDDGSRTVVVRSLPAGAMSELRRALFLVPRLSSNPNKLMQLLAQLPYRFEGLTEAEADTLEGRLDELGAVLADADDEDFELPDEPTPSLDPGAPEVTLVTEGALPAGRVLGPVVAVLRADDTPEGVQTAVQDGYVRLAELARERGAGSVVGVRSSLTPARGDRMLVLVEGTALAD